MSKGFQSLLAARGSGSILDKHVFLNTNISPAVYNNNNAVCELLNNVPTGYVVIHSVLDIFTIIFGGLFVNVTCMIHH